MDVEPTPKSGGSAMIPVAFALVGIALGGAALYFTLNGRTSGEQALDDLRAQLSAAQTAAAEASQKAADLDAKVTSLAQTSANLGSSVQSLHTSTNEAVATLTTAIREDRGALVDLDASVKVLAARLAPPPPAPAQGAATGAAASGASAAPAASGEMRVHVIQSGDILSNIARTYGVSLAALLEANPGIDPNRLQIGQKINIPPPRAPSAPATPAGN